jgi:hypothetical protein
MQFLDIQNRIQALATFAGWSDIVPAPNYATLANQAWQEMCWIAEFYVTSETLTVKAGQQDVTTKNLYKDVLDVDWNGGIVRRSDEAYERSANPAWRYRQSGNPARWTLAQYSVLSLTPPPNVGGSLYVRGIAQGPLMQTPTDQPGQAFGVGFVVPAYFHEGVCKRGACLLGEQFETMESSPRLATWSAQYNAYCNDARTGLTTGYSRRAAQGELMPEAAPQGQQQ